MGIVMSLSHPSVEARIWPRMWAQNPSVPDRIVVNVIHVCCEVTIITDGMFPKTPLPHGALAMLPA